MKEDSFSLKLFGGEVKVIIYNFKGEKEKLEKIMEKVETEALRLQKIFNFYDEKSEISILNRERKMKVSGELLDVLRKSIRISELTNGNYDASLGKKFLERKSKGNDINLKCSYKDVKILGNIVSLVNEDVLVDLGSIAKGSITDRLGEFLRKHGVREFLIDSRGDILVSGSLWHVFEIQHPRSMEKNIGKIKVRNCAVATSGDYMQFHGDYKKSHIVNSGNVISVTVISDSLEEADAYATAFFVSDKKTREILANNKNVKALVVFDDLSSEKYNRFEELMENE